MKTADIRQLHTLIVQTLWQCTGLTLNQRKLVASWIIATYSLPTLSIFPILTVRGSMGTGKSQVLNTCAAFCRNPHRLTLEGSTLPTVRDAMALARFDTVVIEEGDHAWGDENHAFERLLNSRYSLDTESTALKVQTTVQRTVQRCKESTTINKTDERRVFGASVIHKRNQWRDPVMSTKSVLLLCRPALNRDPETIKRFDPQGVWVREGRELVANSTVIEIPEAKRPARIFGRVWDCWEPIVRMAVLQGDEEFDSWLTEAMLAESERLTRSQGAEPEIVALNILLAEVFGDMYQTPNFGGIRLSLMSQKLRVQRIDMTSHQFASHLRELGFRLAKSGGDIKVYATPESVVRAAEQAGVGDDDAVNQLAESMNAANCDTKNEEKIYTQGGGERGGRHPQVDSKIKT
jgi:hypothetical protein